MKKILSAILNKVQNFILNRKKEVYILRGVPGCGKSTVAESIGGVICCADDYFMVDGEYRFDMAKIGNAHSYCKWLFYDAMDRNEPRIVVANTSTRAEDVEYYRNVALRRGYKVFVLTVENWHGGVDVHNVPMTAIEKMEIALKNSIRLR